MAQRRKATQIFSTSFLDILACTVGAVLFLIMALAIDLALARPDPAQQAQESSLRRALQELLAEAAAQEPDDAAPSQVELALEARREALNQRILELTPLVAKAEAAAKVAEASRPKAARQQTQRLEAILPRATRATQKEQALHLDCLPAKIERLRVSVKPLPDSPQLLSVELHPEASLATREMAPGRRPLAPLLRGVSPRTHFVVLHLRPGGIPTYRLLRPLLRQRGFEVAWEVHSDNERRLEFPKGGGGGEGPRTD